MRYSPQWMSLPEVVNMLVEARDQPRIAVEGVVARVLIDGALPDGPDDQLMTATDWQDSLTAQPRGRVDFSTGRVTIPNRGVLWPRFERSRVLAVFELNEINNPPAVDAVTPGRGGRPSKFNWDQFYIEVIRQAEINGITGSRAELHRHMLQWTQNNWGDEPAESSIRDRIRRIYETLQLPEAS